MEMRRKLVAYRRRWLTLNGKKVLLIDADAQCSLTASLGYPCG
jgi:cellulose biosynthesis protein BcsQ